MSNSSFSRHSNFSDSQLLSRFKEENDLAFLGALYHRYMELTMGLCMKYLKNPSESEDAVMEIFELLVKRVPHHDIDNFRSWLYRLASNYCLDILRKKKRVQEKDSEFQIMQNEMEIRHYDEWLNEENEDREVVFQRLENCMEELKSDQQKSIQLFYLEKKSYEEVSNILNTTWSKTRSLIQNGRRNLKNCMEQKHESGRAK